MSSQLSRTVRRRTRRSGTFSSSSCSARLLSRFAIDLLPRRLELTDSLDEARSCKQRLETRVEDLEVELTKYVNFRFLSRPPAPALPALRTDTRSHLVLAVISPNTSSSSRIFDFPTTTFRPSSRRAPTGRLSAPSTPSLRSSTSSGSFRTSVPRRARGRRRVGLRSGRLRRRLRRRGGNLRKRGGRRPTRERGWTRRMRS